MEIAPERPASRARGPRSAAAVLALLAVACLGGREAAGREPRKFTLATWSNYVPPEVLADFEKEFDCKVDTPGYESNEDLLAKLREKDSGYDVAVPSDMVLPVMIRLGLLEKLDKGRLKNLGNLDPEFLGREGDPANDWSIPYTWGTAGLAWRTDKLGPTVDSWGAFLHEGARGNAYLLSESRDAIAAALLFAGHGVNTTDPAHLADAKRVLLSWMPRLKGVTGEVKKTLVGGEGWLVQAYNGDVAQARRERSDLAYAVPKEGGVFWVDNLVIPKGAQVDLAHAYLDFVLRPEVAARISEGILYAVPNRAALPLVDEKVRSDPVVYAPADVRARCQVEKDLGDDATKYADLWEEVRASQVSTNGGGWLVWAVLGALVVLGLAFGIGWWRGRRELAGP